MTSRAAVVVGGASGIGRAVAHALAADNFRVTVADRNTEGAHAVVVNTAGYSGVGLIPNCPSKISGRSSTSASPARSW